MPTISYIFECILPIIMARAIPFARESGPEHQIRRLGSSFQQRDFGQVIDLRCPSSPFVNLG